MSQISPVRSSPFAASIDQIKNGWSDGIYMILDGFGNLPHIVYSIDGNPAYFNWLYSGTPYETIKDVSPVLVKVSASSPLMQWYEEEGAAKDYGILITSSASNKTTLRHLQLLLEISMPNQSISLLRYYDPVVMRYAAPILAQKHAFRGPLDNFVYPARGADKFYSLYESGAEYQALDTSAMEPPVLSLSHEELELFQKGAEQAFTEKVADMLSKKFTDKSWDDCHLAASASSSTCKEHGLKNSSTIAALAILAAVGKDKDEQVLQLLQQADFDEPHKRAALQQYFENYAGGEQNVH